MKTADAIDRLKAANPFPDGLPDPSFDPVARALDSQPHARGGGRRRAGLLAPAAAVLVAVCVAGVAVAMLGHSTSRSQSAAGGAPSRTLLSQFAILRRPQTARDRDLPKPFRQLLTHPPFDRMLLPGLTRVVRWLPNRADGRVLLFVVVQGPSESRPTKVSLFSGVIDRRSHDGVFDGASTGSSPYEPDQLWPEAGDGYAEQLVPDAVTRVKWVFATRTVNPTIKNNVAFAPASISEAADIKSVIWYGAGGRVIAHENRASRRGHRNRSGRSVQPVSIHRALAGNAIAAAHFGQDPSAVRAVVDRLLGRTGGRYAPQHGCRCGIDHLIAWRSATTRLMTFFDHSRLVGYTYSTVSTRSAPALPAHGVALATGRGLRIGDRLARGRQLYGRAFRLSNAQGGTWSVHTAAGPIDGFAYTGSADGPNDTDVSPRSLVATISAGHVGGPALSP